MRLPGWREETVLPCRCHLCFSCTFGETSFHLAFACAGHPSWDFPLCPLPRLRLGPLWETLDLEAAAWVVRTPPHVPSVPEATPASGPQCPFFIPQILLRRKVPIRESVSSPRSVLHQSGPQAHASGPGSLVCCEEINELVPEGTWVSAGRSGRALGGAFTAVTPVLVPPCSSPAASLSSPG